MYTKIKEFRNINNMTQIDLAREVWVRRETIIFLEKWKYNPSLKLAKKVADILKTSIDELFFFDDE